MKNNCLIFKGNKSFKSDNLPGLRMGNYQKIKIGVCDNDYFWIPENYPDSGFECVKDNCSYITDRTTDLTSKELSTNESNENKREIPREAQFRTVICL